MSGLPDLVRAPPTAQALLPEEYAASRDSSASSAPSTSRARWWNSLDGVLANSRCWAWNTASGVQGSHGSGPAPVASNSGASAWSPSLTPVTKAATNSCVSAPRLAHARCAVSTIRVRRAQTSQGSWGRPSTAAAVPVARRRWCSSCHARSRAAAYP